MSEARRKGEVETPGIAEALAEIKRRNAPATVGDVIADVARRFSAAGAHYCGATPDKKFPFQEEVQQ